MFRFKKKIKYVLSVIAPYILVTILTIVFILNSDKFFANFNKDKNLTPDSNIEEMEFIEEYTAGDEFVDNLERVKPLSSVYNVLLIGVDMPQYNEVYTRSDVNMILSINPDTNTITMASVLRDTYVDIPNHGKNKLNASFAIGGPNLLMETINSNFNLNIEKYIYIDFDAFVSIVDTLDGVDIELTERETEHVFGAKKEDGVYHLNGNESLNYVRIRAFDSDFQRTERQRKLMTAMYDKFSKEQDARMLYDLFTEVYPQVNTNISFADAVSLLSQYLKMNNEDVQLKQARVPFDGTFEEKFVSGQSVVNIDMEKNQILLNNALYKQEGEQDNE